MGQRSQKLVLFLCTGNYYRSRFAESLFNSVAGKMGLPWRASSRGLALERGVNNVGPMAAAAIKALEAPLTYPDDWCGEFQPSPTRPAPSPPESDLRRGDTEPVI